MTDRAQPEPGFGGGEHGPRVTAPRLRQVTALDDERYLATFDTGRGQVQIAFTVAPGRGAPVVVAEPEVLRRNQFGDPRPILAAVAAVHAARQLVREPATTVQDRVISGAIETARRDGVALRRLIDWPLSGAAGVVDNLQEVALPERTWVVASGLGELDAAGGDDLSVAAGVLPALVARFAGAREVRTASARVRAQALATWRVPPVPVGLSPDQQGRLAELRDRAARLDEVYVLVGPAGEELPVARTPELDLLVVALPEVAG